MQRRIQRGLRGDEGGIGAVEKLIIIGLFALVVCFGLSLLGDDSNATSSAQGESISGVNQIVAGITFTEAPSGGTLRPPAAGPLPVSTAMMPMGADTSIPAAAYRIPASDYTVPGADSRIPAAETSIPGVGEMPSAEYEIPSGMGMVSANIEIPSGSGMGALDVPIAEPVVPRIVDVELANGEVVHFVPGRMHGYACEATPGKYGGYACLAERESGFFKPSSSKILNLYLRHNEEVRCTAYGTYEACTSIEERYENAVREFVNNPDAEIIDGRFREAPLEYLRGGVNGMARMIAPLLLPGDIWEREKAIAEDAGGWGAHLGNAVVNTPDTTLRIINGVLQAPGEMLEACLGRGGSASECGAATIPTIIDIAVGTKGAGAMARTGALDLPPVVRPRNLEYLGEGSFSRAYRDGDEVVKIVKDNVGAGGAESWTLDAAAKARLADLTVEFQNDLARVIDTIPEARVSAPGAMRLPYQDGLLITDLDPMARINASDQLQDAIARAQNEFGGAGGGVVEGGWRISVDSNPANFRFDADGNLTSWFDPVLVGPPDSMLTPSGD